MEIGAAFVVGAVAGGWFANSMASVRGAPIPPPPPPPPPAGRAPMARRRAVDLHIERILDPDTGEDKRGAPVQAHPLREEAKLSVKLSDIALVKLKKAPRPLTMDEKRATFAAVPLFVELLKTTPQAK